MQSKKQSSWSVVKPLLIMSIALVSIIFILHAATVKQLNKEETCTENACKKIKADVLNAITVKLM